MELIALYRYNLLFHCDTEALLFNIDSAKKIFSLFQTDPHKQAGKYYDFFTLVDSDASFIFLIIWSLFSNVYRISFFFEKKTITNSRSRIVKEQTSIF